MAPFSSEPDPRDSPEFRFGVGSDKQYSQITAMTRTSTRTIMIGRGRGLPSCNHSLGSHEERASSVEAHGDRPTATAFHALRVLSPSKQRLKQFPQGMGVSRA